MIPLPEEPLSYHENLTEYFFLSVRSFIKLRGLLLPGTSEPNIHVDSREAMLLGLGNGASGVDSARDLMKMVTSFTSKLESTPERREILTDFCVAENQRLQTVLMAVGKEIDYRGMERSDPREGYLPKGLNLVGFLKKVEAVDSGTKDTLLKVLATAELMDRIRREPDQNNLSPQLGAIGESLREYPARMGYHVAQLDRIIERIGQQVHAARPGLDVPGGPGTPELPREGRGGFRG